MSKHLTTVLAILALVVVAAPALASEAPCAPDLAAELAEAPALTPNVVEAPAVPTPEFLVRLAPQPCGNVLCQPGTFCCNASCGICTPPGVECIQIVCDPEI